MAERLELTHSEILHEDPQKAESLKNLEHYPPTVGRLNNQSLQPSEFISFFEQNYGMLGSSFLRQVLERIKGNSPEDMDHVEVRELSENLRKFYAKNSPLSNILTQTRQDTWKKLLRQLVGEGEDRTQIVNQQFVYNGGRYSRAMGRRLERSWAEGNVKLWESHSVVDLVLKFVLFVKTVFGELKEDDFFIKYEDMSHFDMQKEFKPKESSQEMSDQKNKQNTEFPKQAQLKSKTATLFGEEESVGLEEKMSKIKQFYLELDIVEDQSQTLLAEMLDLLQEKMREWVSVQQIKSTVWRLAEMVERRDMDSQELLENLESQKELEDVRLENMEKLLIEYLDFKSEVREKHFSLLDLGNYVHEYLDSTQDRQDFLQIIDTFKKYAEKKQTERGKVRSNLSLFLGDSPVNLRKFWKHKRDQQYSNNKESSNTTSGGNQDPSFLIKQKRQGKRSAKKRKKTKNSKRLSLTINSTQVPTKPKKLDPAVLFTTDELNMSFDDFLDDIQERRLIVEGFSQRMHVFVTKTFPFVDGKIQGKKNSAMVREMKASLGFYFYYQSALKLEDVMEGLCEFFENSFKIFESFQVGQARLSGELAAFLYSNFQEMQLGRLKKLAIRVFALVRNHQNTRSVNSKTPNIKARLRSLFADTLRADDLPSPKSENIKQGIQLFEPKMKNEDGWTEYEVKYEMPFYEQKLNKQVVDPKNRPWYLRPHHIETITEHPKSVKDNLLNPKYYSRLEIMPDSESVDSMGDYEEIGVGISESSGPGGYEAWKKKQVKGVKISAEERSARREIKNSERLISDLQSARVALRNRLAFYNPTEIEGKSRFYNI